MAFQQNFGAFQYSEDKQKQNSVSQPITASENLNGCFDCNICLDSSYDPVVTLCGHLYCWPCIYKWLNVQSSSFKSHEQPKCPVCKAYISTSSLIPLYGRGTLLADSESKKPQLNLAIPQRPPALGMNALVTTSTPITSNTNQQNHVNQQYFSHNYISTAPPAFGGTVRTSLFSPAINMVGEMIFSGMFGSSGTSLFAYPYSNSYPFPGNGSPRLRRQEMQLDTSLNRVSIFLFCCLALCLILF